MESLAVSRNENLPLFSISRCQNQQKHINALANQHIYLSTCFYLNDAFSVTPCLTDKYEL